MIKTGTMQAFVNGKVCTVRRDVGRVARGAETVWRDIHAVRTALAESRGPGERAVDAAVDRLLNRIGG